MNNAGKKAFYPVNIHIDDIYTKKEGVVLKNPNGGSIFKIKIIEWYRGERLQHFRILCVLISAFILICVALLSSNIKNEGQEMDLNDMANKTRHIALLGASIGMRWNIESLPERINSSDYDFEYVGSGLFDKTDTLKRIIERKENKPDAIFIKECAAYFPGPLDNYKKWMKKWIKECQDAPIIPIPVTVVPVTRLHSFKLILIDLIRGRNPIHSGNPFCHRRNTAIIAYNDWIRTYCKQNGLPCLDLEAVLRYSEDNRYLREDLAKIDGLHINSKAYKILDQVVVPTLKTVEWENKRGN